ncbi:MAG: UvrD-helicase domain-containing protein [Nannocystaceae bacterium]|nr:UvrD-helicase domain-containing protein [Nannocystaceae bacterium]
MDLGHLNPSQRLAVTTTEGPLLVLAGAGSGKTRVITHRVVYLLEQGVPADRIVALSFTNKAAGEMRARLGKMVGPKIAGALVLSTFHSLGVRILRSDPEPFGMPGSRFSILDQGDVYGVVRGLLREHGHHVGGDRRFDLGAIVQRISLWKNNFIDPESVQSEVVDEYDVVAASIYEPYFDRLGSLGAVDFDDLVCLVARVLTQDEVTRDRWQQRFDYVMVDEYQDTNSAQLQLLRGIVRLPNQNLCVVGDDDQAIYGWRGADVRNILAFGEHFEGAKEVKLQENYRSRGPILEAANSVVRNNKDRHEKELIVTRHGGDPVNVVVAADGNAEAMWIGKKIRRMVVDQTIDPCEVAVLYRSALQAKLIEEELQTHGVAYRVLGGQSMYDKKEVKDAQAYLKAIVVPRDELAVRRALETPPRGVGRKTMDILSSYAKANHIPLIEAVHRLDSIPDLPGRSVEGLASFSRIIRRAQVRAREAGASVALREVLDDIKLRDHIRHDVGSAKATEFRWQSIQWLLGSIQRYEERVAAKGPDARPHWPEYLGTLSLDGAANSPEPEEAAPVGKVTLATLHSSKGLEWDHVFIIGVEEGTMPHRRVEAPRASDAIAGDLDEERRLFYVGITRAREQLWLTRGAGRIDRGREIERVPSRFLEELPDTVHHYDINKEEELSSQDIGDIAGEFLSSIAAPSDS